MKVSKLFADENAVSPVIGVILMVAITVILAAVIGTFVLGLGENVQDSAPQANFQFEYTASGGNGFEAVGASSPDATDEIKVTHTGGEDVSVSELSVQVGSATTISDVSSGSSDAHVSTGWADPVATGATLTLAESGSTSDAEMYTGGESVRVVWTSPSGGTSNTIGQSTVPS